MSMLQKVTSRLGVAGAVSIFVFLTLFTLSNARAQVNPVYKRMVRNGWNYSSIKSHPRFTATELNSDYLRILGYTNATIAHLEKAGIDIKNIYKNRIFNKKIWTVLSDCIVVGTVSKITYFPRGRPLYDGLASVRVDTFLENSYDLPKGNISVLQGSGPIGPHLVSTVYGMPSLSPGEHVILFLTASGLVFDAAVNNNTRLYKKLTNSPKIYFKILAKYDVQSGKVVSNKRKENLANVTDTIQSVLNLTNHSVLINR